MHAILDLFQNCMLAILDLFQNCRIFLWLICHYRQRLNVFVWGVQACMGLWMVCRWLLWLTCSCLCLCVCGVEVQVRYAGGIGRGVTRETDEERWSNTTQNALAPSPNTYLCKGIKQARKPSAMPDQNYRCVIHRQLLLYLKRKVYWSKKLPTEITCTHFIPLGDEVKLSFSILRISWPPSRVLRTHDHKTWITLYMPCFTLTNTLGRKFYLFT